jgi:hypothetical protein
VSVTIGDFFFFIYLFLLHLFRLPSHQLIVYFFLFLWTLFLCVDPKGETHVIGCGQLVCPATARHIVTPSRSHLDPFQQVTILFFFPVHFFFFLEINILKSLFITFFQVMEMGLFGVPLSGSPI